MTVTYIAIAAFLTSLVMSSSAGAQSGSDAPPAPADSVTLAGALALSLERNPFLQAVRWDIEAAAGRLRQAGARPNPEVSMELENIGGTLPGLSESEMTLSIGQVFELGGKRGSRIQAARAEEGLARSQYDLARMEVVSQVIRRYFEALAAQQTIDLQNEAMEIADEIRTSIGRRVEAGAISPAEQTRAGIEFENTLLRRQIAEQELALVRIRLASLWGVTEPPSFRIGEEPMDLAPVPAVEILQSELKEAPRLKLARRDLEARQALLKLARSGRMPDMQIEAGYRNIRESDEHTYVAGLTLPLPLFNRNHGAIAEAQALVSRAEAEIKHNEVDLSRQLSEAVTAAALARQRITTLRDRILPAAQLAFQEIKAGYELGRFSYVDLLEARRAWTEARHEGVEARLQYHLAIAETEFLLGRALVHPISDLQEGYVR